jgi:hypothetical protein
MDYFSGRSGSMFGVRTMVALAATSRRRCSCCNRRATHMGMGDGVGLTTGCEWLIRRWVKDPVSANRTRPTSPRGGGK